MMTIIAGKHGIFEFAGSKPLTDECREEIRTEYRTLLERAKEITYHKSGWVASTFFATPEDSKRASALNEEMFITCAVHPSQIEYALKAIFAE